MRSLFFQRGFPVLLTLCAFAAVARGQSYSTISVGYANLHTSELNGLFYDRDGVYLDGDVAWKLPRPNPPFLIGFGFGGSGYFQSQNVVFPINSNFNGQTTLYSDVGLFEIEPRIAITLWSPWMRGLFLRPRLGAGLLVDSYGIDNIFQSNGTTFIGTQYHTGAAIEVHPNVQAGYSWGAGSVGVEAGYMPAWGDFGGLGHRAQEIRVGLFFNWLFY